MVCQVLGQDLNHGLRSKFVHGVVLVVSPGQVAEHVPGQLVDPLDHLGHVGLEVGGGEHVLQLGELLVGDLPLPLQLAAALLNHGAQTRVVIHVLLEGLGEALGSELADVHGEDDEVEVPLDVVHDLGLEVGLPVVRGHIKGHLGLDDALTDVLNTSSTRGRGSQVNQLVNLGLGNLGLGECSKQLLDDLKLSHLHSVPVLLHLNVNAGQAQLLLLEGIEDVVGDDAPHPVQLPGQLQLLYEGAAHNGSGGSADASLAVEDNWARGGGVLQHGNNLVKVLLGGSHLLVHGDPDGLQLGHLVLDGSIDLIEGGHSRKLLRDLLIVCPLLGVLTKLVLEVLEVLSPLLPLLGELGLQLGGLLRVVDLQVEVDALGRVASGERLAIDINDWLLSKVDPEDVLLVSVLLEDGLEALLKTLHRGLTSTKEREAGQPAEVRGAISPGSALCKLVDPLKGIGHRLQVCHGGSHLRFSCRSESSNKSL